MHDTRLALRSANGESTALALRAATNNEHPRPEGEGRGEGSSSVPPAQGPEPNAQGPTSGGDWPHIARRLKLTDRESQVLELIWHGRKFASIAHQLRITPHTVDVHWRRIKAKLHLAPGSESLRAACRLIESIRTELLLAAATEPLIRDLEAAQAEIERLEGRVREIESASQEGVVSEDVNQ